MPRHIDDLPDAVLARIFRAKPAPPSRTLSLVCRRWHRVRKSALTAPVKVSEHPNSIESGYFEPGRTVDGAAALLAAGYSRVLVAWGCHGGWGDDPPPTRGQLARMRGAETMDLGCCEFPAARLPELAGFPEVVVWGCYGIADLTPLADCARVDLAACEDLDDIAALFPAARSGRLRTLELHETAVPRAQIREVLDVPRLVPPWKSWPLTAAEKEEIRAGDPRPA